MSDARSDPPPTAIPQPGEPPRTGLAGLIRDILGLNRAVLAILLAVPISLTLLDYYGMPWQYPQHDPQPRSMRPQMTSWTMRSVRAPLAGYLGGIELPGPEPLQRWIWWGLCCLLFLVVLPMLVGWLFARAPPRALGLRLKGTGREAWTYLFLFLIFAPVIYLISRTKDFQLTYPFYRPPSGELGQDFLFFEIIYCAQFFAVEFFFRGFIVLGLKRHIGWASVLVMLAPYCMIHYYKPMPEAMGAIGAGLVLGTLSWRTGTILYGWALHYSVALSMDLLALHHRPLT